MDCKRSEELLPWLLNNTLEDDERQQVRAHLATCQACQRALGETAFAGEIFAQHIPTAALVDYGFGRPPAELDRELIERHLASCVRCSEQLEMVRACHDDAVDATDNPDDEIADGIEVESPPPAPVLAFPTHRRWQLGAIAAGLVALICSFGWWQSEQLARHTEARMTQLAAQLQAAQQVVEEPARLAINVPVFELFSHTLLRRRTTGDEPPAMMIPPGSDRVVLLLQPADEGEDAPAYASFEVEVRDAARQRLLWRQSGLMPLPLGDISIDLPVGEMPTADLEILLFGIDAGGARSADPWRYTLTLKSPER